MKKTKEPLAKFHASINAKGQIVIPKKDREFLGLDKDDVVEVIVRKVLKSESKLVITGVAYVMAELSSKGLITIPQEVREELDITQDSIIEVLLVGFYKFDELISPKRKSLLSKLNRKPFRIITNTDEESRLIEKSMSYYITQISRVPEERYIAYKESITPVRAMANE